MEVVLVIILIVLIYLIFAMLFNWWPHQQPAEPIFVGAPTDDLTKGICYQRYFSNVDPGIAGDMAADTNWILIKDRRDDLNLFQNMQVQTLRLYEWNYTVSHRVFINDTCAAGLKFQLPISNFVMGWQGAPYDVQNFYRSALREVTQGNAYRPCVHSIAISNEPFLTVGDRSLVNLDRAINDILNAEEEAGVTQNLPPITVPVAFADVAGEGPAIYYGRRLNELPAVQRLGSRFILSINTTNPADSVKNEFADVYQQPFMITEWGLTPLNYPPGEYAVNLQRETETLLRYAREGQIQLRGVFGFIYFKQVWKDGAELNFGFTCFPDSLNVVNCLQRRNCPPHGAELGIYPNDNSLLALANAYGGNIQGLEFGECPPLRIIR